MLRRCTALPIRVCAPIVMANGDVKIRVLTRMADVPAEDWDACAAGEAGEPEPFLRHAFLSALEEAGCATARSGWQPQHLVLEAPDGTIRASLLPI